MGWGAAVVGALGVAQYQQQGAIGKYNQAVNNRNAQVLEGQAIQIEQKTEFDIAQFDKDYYRLTGEVATGLAKSGVQIGSGSAANIVLSNAYEKKIQEDLIKYNSKVAAANKMEEANFARISGTIARNEARLAQIGTIASAGTSLITMNQGSFGTKSYNQGASGSNKRLFTTNSTYNY